MEHNQRRRSSSKQLSLLALTRSSSRRSMDLDEACERSPYLATLRKKGKLAPSRLVELVKAAQRDDAPPAPALGECCGSSCSPCVTELWKQELRVWTECQGEGEG